MRARTNISLKDRYTTTLSDFKGVDLNTSPLRVASNRASSMKNLICDNGVNHKRPGWEEQFRIVETVDGVEAAQAIHGVFPFDEDGTEVLLVHAGKGFYRAVEADGRWSTNRLDDGTLSITEERSQCFYRGGKAFLVGCGNYLCYGKHDGESYTLCAVEDIAYVPTTTIGIGGSEVQESLDAVNLLTRKRINTIVGHGITYDSDGKALYTAEYVLDGRIDKGADVTVDGEGYFGEYPTKFYKYTFTLNLSLDGISLTGACEGKAFFGYSLSADESLALSNVMAQIEEGQDYDTLCFYFPAKPLTADTPNITITYSAITESGHDAQRIQNCRFGSTFGVNGADDRLFLSGNSRYPNMDFWSEYDDFTYFPDGNTMEVGGAHSAITAYARLSDTTLAVLKEEKAGEPTIFYRTGRGETQSDGITEKQWFPVSAGIAGDGTINPHAVATLAGDVLTLTRSGVHALVLSSNVASGERYTRERSRPIYKELSRKDLSTAAGIVYRNRYYLATGDGACYVADTHYKATFEGSTDYNYEWWVWDNIPATCFAEHRDRLLFGTAVGLVCAFTQGVFSDRTHTELGSGDLLDDGSGGVIYGERVVPTLGDRVVLEGNVYARLAEGVTVSDGRCTVTEDEIGRLWEGQEVFADTVGDSGLAVGTAYRIGEIDAQELTLTLTDGNGDPVTPSAGGFRLLECVDGKELYVAGINEDGDEEQDFTVARGYSCDDAGDRVWNKLFLTRYNGEEAEWTGRYIHVTPVCAEWVTPVMDLGTNARSKTLLGITIATEPGVDGRVTFGYETRRVWRRVVAGRALAISTEAGDMTVGGGEAFSFDDIDFDAFSFDTSFACSYTRRMSLRNFNFIVFRFGSETEQDCAVSGVTLKYKINQNNKGVR
ncbi:MAG: hypothetical protein IJX39_04715 [Clostridia bacterium]|nr:hypothetical protein [Clostridia bacterium]